VKIELCGIPAGSFTMGSDESGQEDEKPVHKVTLTKAFWLGRTEVTQGQWQSVMGTTQRDQARRMLEDDTVYDFGSKKSTLRDMFGKSRTTDPGEILFGEGADHPVYWVSWNEAVAFCGKLNAKGLLPAGWKWALPSEAQWEYACRAGTTGDYAGDLDEMAWHAKNSDGKTHEVATKKANAWGLCDMHGNVCEWCADWYGDYPAGAATDQTGPAEGLLRVVCGGGWSAGGADCRSAYRYGNYPGIRNLDGGFRVAAVPAGP